MLSCFNNFVPFCFAVFYPNVGTILSYIGSVAGFMIIYCMPVLVYLKRLKTRITNPLLAQALETNNYTIKRPGVLNNSPLVSPVSSPTIKIGDSLVGKNK